MCCLAPEMRALRGELAFLGGEVCALTGEIHFLTGEICILIGEMPCPELVEGFLKRGLCYLRSYMASL